MTKLIPVIISLLLLFSIVGCTNNQDKQLLNAVKEPTLITPSPATEMPPLIMMFAYPLRTLQSLAMMLSRSCIMQRQQNPTRLH